MDLDTCATWGVFIDQVDPPGDPQDDDEREGRMRIRALMLSYLANEARPHIQRHMVRPENEDVLIAGLLRVRCSSHSSTPSTKFCLIKRPLKALTSKTSLPLRTFSSNFLPINYPLRVATNSLMRSSPASTPICKITAIQNNCLLIPSRSFFFAKILLSRDVLPTLTGYCSFINNGLSVNLFSSSSRGKEGLL